MLADQLLFLEPSSLSHFYTENRRALSLASAWFHGVMVSTLDSESSDLSSNLSGTC